MKFLDELPAPPSRLKYAPHADQLRAHPGLWGDIEMNAPKSKIAGIRANKAFDGPFEIKSVPSKDDKTRVHIYGRYVGLVEEPSTAG